MREIVKGLAACPPLVIAPALLWGVLEFVALRRSLSRVEERNSPGKVGGI